MSDLTNDLRTASLSAAPGMKAIILHAADEIERLTAQVDDYRVLIGHAPDQGFSEVIAERDDARGWAEHFLQEMKDLCESEGLDFSDIRLPWQ